MWQQEGLNGFTRGLGPTLIRYVDQTLPIITQQHCWLTEQLSLAEDHHSRMVRHSLHSSSPVEHLVLRIRSKLEAGVFSSGYSSTYKLHIYVPNRKQNVHLKIMLTAFSAASPFRSRSWHKPDAQGKVTWQALLCRCNFGLRYKPKALSLGDRIIHGVD